MFAATGNSISPAFIFPRKKYKDHFVRDGPTGSIGTSNKSGWINEEIFSMYLKYKVNQISCNNENRALLILDNHESHVSMASIQLAKQNGLILLTIPPHTSHRLQPLDRSVFGPLKSKYNQAMDEWMRSNPGKIVTIYNIPALRPVSTTSVEKSILCLFYCFFFALASILTARFNRRSIKERKNALFHARSGNGPLINKAYLAAFTPGNIQAGFKSTDIYPFCRDICDENAFAPSELTNRFYITRK